MIDQVELMRVVDRYRGDAVVMPVFRANLGWEEVSGNPRRDIPIGTYRWGGAMGTGSSFALGLALARPDTRVIIFDGDGSLLMNLGSLVTASNKAPRNLYHFVMNNGVYATTGGQDVPGKERASLSDLARAAGYARSYHFDNLEDFATQAESIFQQEGPVLIEADVIPNVRLPGQRASQSQTGAPRPQPGERPQVVAGLMRELGTLS